MVRSEVGVGNAGSRTPAKPPHKTRSQFTEVSTNSQNVDPNLPSPCPSQKSSISPAVKSARSKKPAPKAPCWAVSSPPAVQERKFFIARKNTKRAVKDHDMKRCRQVAYETLRASQEDFFKTDQAISAFRTADPSPDEELCHLKREEKDLTDTALRNVGSSAGKGFQNADDSELGDLEGSSKLRKMRTIMLDEAMNTIPEPGRVMHLVKAFESLLAISKDREGEKVEGSKKNVWPLPGLQQAPNVPESEVSSSSVFSSSGFFFPPKDFERDSRIYSSIDSNDERLSFGSRTSGGSRRSRRNSTDSSGSSWHKKLKVTSQQPFKLRTEQRGRLKEEYFLHKVREMIMEEEKRRIPIAQGLPWTTDEPECLAKPPVRERTEPIDLVLHSDVRAVERAEFDHYVSERMSFVEQLKLERDRQRKLEEEEEIRRLRKELVPRAQPMPYFDRPFIPKKSSRPRTIPKEPRFHFRPQKACYLIAGGNESDHEV